MSAKPNLFIIGGPKTGSTSLHYYLSQHPDIYMSEDKEPHYFSEDLRIESDDFHKRQKYFRIRTPEQYVNCFINANDQKIIGEASTSYIYSKNAAKNIAQYKPEAKIIAILREPVDMAYSWFFWERYKSQESLEDFYTAIEMEEKRKQNPELIPKNVDFPCCVFYSDIVNHYENLNRYLEHFPKENILVLIYDDYKKDTVKTYQQVLKFLEVDTSFLPDFSQQNVTTTARFGKLKYWLDYVILDRIKLMFYNQRNNVVFKTLGAIYYKSFSQKATREPLDEQTNKRLQKRFYNMVEQTGELLEVDLLTKWNYK